MAKNKFYVVWQGAKPGIYHSWADCQAQIKGYKGAKFKGFPSLAEAQAAYQDSPLNHIGTKTPTKKTPLQSNSSHQPIQESLSVDAACSGNPGVMEYQGVYTKTGEVWFHQKFPVGTNNIGEFLALAHGIAYLEQKKIKLPIYTDSRIAMAWLKKKKCGSKLARNRATQPAFNLVDRAEKWLAENSFQVKVLKWDTKNWGEIPADFGRK
ncbi:MAG: ribonuclease H family protein [Marinilabiliaceae bacterium]|nr:ribonuclease H family protein [Marinilabiliaceae bacterium]